MIGLSRNACKFLDRNVAVALFTIHYSLFIIPASAQTYRDSVQLEQVVVTGTRTPKSLAETPVPTRVITAKEIERADATDIQDLLLQEMPGAEFSYAMNQQTHLNLSGFGGQSVLFLVDGERLAGETMDDVDFCRLTMGGVERIEIVKGAASALYGSNAGGGVVNIITIHPSKLQTPHSSLLTPNSTRLHLDSRWGRHGSQRYNARFSVERRRWDNRLSASFSDIDNYSVKSAADPATRVISDVYGSKVVSVRDRLTVNPIDQLRLTGRLGYYFRQVSRVPTEPERYRDFTAGLRAEWDPSQRDHVELSYTFDQYDKSAKLTLQDLDVRTYSNVQNSLRLLFNHTFPTSDVLTVGGDFMRDYLLNTKLTDGSRHQHTADAFVQYDLSLSDQWELVGALRYDHISDSISRLTPKLSIRWRPRHNLSLRAGYGMGFRAPSLKERYYEFDMAGIWIVEGNEHLRSEVSHNVNASVEYTKGRYNVMVMGYYNSVRDKISTGIPYYRAVPYVATVSQPASESSQPASLQLCLPYTNLDSYSVYGCDVTARARWGIVTAKLGYAFTKERIPKDGDGRTINNQYIPARPHALICEVALDKTFTKNYALSAALTGRLLSAVDNEEYRDYYDISQGTATIHYPAYTLWKLMVVQRLWERAKVTLTVDNLLNYKPKYYYLNAPVTDGTNVMLGLSLDLGN